MPDLAGGVLFQYVDPAEPEWVWDEGVHQWVTAWPSGEPEPIRRQRTPGGPTEIAVPADGSRLWLLDVGMVDGEPAVAFGRLVGGDEPIAVGFDYCAEVDRCGDFSWRVELVVRSIDGGEERVVHRALWQPGITESTAYTACSSGKDSSHSRCTPIQVTLRDGGAWSELFDPDGERIETGYRATPWCVGCDVVADLAPFLSSVRVRRAVPRSRRRPPHGPGRGGAGRHHEVDRTVAGRRERWPDGRHRRGSGRDSSRFNL